MKKIIFILLILSLSIANAGRQEIGIINYINVRASDGMHYFEVNSLTSSDPSRRCDTKPYWVIKDENSAAGKAQLSMLLTAYASGKKILVEGLGTCSRDLSVDGKGEDVDIIQLKTKQ